MLLNNKCPANIESDLSNDNMNTKKYSTVLLLVSRNMLSAQIRYRCRCNRIIP